MDRSILETYRVRLGLGDVPVTPEGLAQVQIAQLRAIPFENLDPFLGVIPATDPDAVADKIFGCQRGGYCFELNTLFGAALAALGFDVARRMARVRRGRVIGPRSHLTLEVTIDGRRFLADAGFGGPGALIPLSFETDAPQDAPNGTYRISWLSETRERVLERLRPEGWEPLYGVDDAHVCNSDIAAANHLCATWSEAPFPHHLMISRYGTTGRLGIFDRDVTEQVDGAERKRHFTDFADFRDTLVASAGIVLTDDDLHRAWQRLSGSDA